jgi:hypothetical protein
MEAIGTEIRRRVLVRTFTFTVRSPSQWSRFHTNRNAILGGHEEVAINFKAELDGEFHQRKYY